MLKLGRATTKQEHRSGTRSGHRQDVGTQFLSFLSTISCLLGHLTFLDSVNFENNETVVSAHPDRHVSFLSSLRQEGMTETVNSGSPGQTFIDLWSPDPVSIYVPSLSSSFLPVSRNSLFQTQLRWVISSPGKGRSQSPPLVLPCRWVPGLRPSGQTKARSSEKYLTIHSDSRHVENSYGPIRPHSASEQEVQGQRRTNVVCHIHRCFAETFS